MVRPIDMHTMLPRLSEVGRIQHTHDQQSQVNQHLANAQGIAKAEHDQQHVIQKDSPQKAAIHEEGKQRGEREKAPPQRKQKQKKSGPSQESPPPKTRSLRLDVKF